MRLQAQRYRHRIAIEERIDERDPLTGAVTWVWQTALDYDFEPLDQVPAEVLTGPGREAIAAGAKQTESSARINLRWFPGLRPDMRLIWQGRVFDITSIEMDATGMREYRVRCTEGLSDGA
jgi:SPP1 family predicted phage head-tail adaptor